MAEQQMVNFFAYETTGIADTNLVELTRQLQRADDCARYFDDQGKDFVPPPCHGFTNLPVLPWLWGRPLNNMTLAYVHSLRPSKVRITTGVTTTDMCTWRVTITIAPNAEGVAIVQYIQQEVQIGYGAGSSLAAVERSLFATNPVEPEE